MSSDHNNNTTLLAVGGAAVVAAVGGFFLLKQEKACHRGKPKLTYFKGRGLAELPRLVLAESGVEYDDVRVENIDELKPILPFGQVPFYEEGDFKLSQSNTIARYIAREHGLYGHGARCSARIDMILDSIGDIRGKVYALRNVPEDKKEEETKKLKDEVLPLWNAHFERLLANNHENGGWAVGKNVSLADIALYNYVFFAKKDYASSFDKTPKLLALADKVAARPKIAQWIKTRPQSEW